MKIITIPHPTLRLVATPVKEVDKKLITLITDLEETLLATRKPKGVGLAAPQVDRLKRMFAINFVEDNRDLRTIINPVIAKHSADKTFGPDENEPYLEGCLSIPGIYGPVPRWEWVELEYQEVKNGTLISTTEYFEDFAARVIQHEYDHLEGILFTDYSVEFDLPLYKDSLNGKKMEEIDKAVLQLV
ncbi:peptide deformylase [Candidatus Woesebacteria bacterium]|nr:peptide deformylase [Candidatus Woesebacteria bacterium]